MSALPRRGSKRRLCHFRVRFLRFQAFTAPFPRHCERALALAMHRPDLAAHINEMKSAARQFAHGDDVAAIHRRPSVGRRVFDLMTVSHVEMLHRCLRVGCRRTRPPLAGDRADSRFCCIAQFHAAMHNAQAGIRVLSTVAAPADALVILHPFLHVMAARFRPGEANASKSE